MLLGNIASDSQPKELRGSQHLTRGVGSTDRIARLARKAPAVRRYHSFAVHSRGDEHQKTLKDAWRDLESAVRPVLSHRAMTDEIRRDLIELAVDDQDVEVENLRKEGFTPEDLSRVVYDKMKNEELPAFFDTISLQESGGLDCIHEVVETQPEKYLWFFIYIGSVIFNIGYLISMDWTIFETYVKDVVGTWDWANISGRIADGGGANSREKVQAALFDDQTFKGNIFGMISDHATRRMLVNAAAVMAVWEMAWIVVQLVHCAHIVWVTKKDKSEYKKYHAVHFFFQKMLRQAASFSAIKLMARVHPSLIYNEYWRWINDAPTLLGLQIGHRRNTYGYLMLTATFVITHGFCAVAAVSAFAVKTLAVSLKMVNSGYSLLFRLGSVLALLNQVMGCIIVENLLQDRLFLFVFGGHDAVYQDDELAYKNVYETRLVRQICEDFWQQGRYFTAVVLLATFDHYDLQQLLIKEKECTTGDRLGLSKKRSASRSVSEPSLQRQREVNSCREARPLRMDCQPKVPADCSPDLSPAESSSRVEKALSSPLACPMHSEDELVLLPDSCEGSLSGQSCPEVTLSSCEGKGAEEPLLEENITVERGAWRQSSSTESMRSAGMGAIKRALTKNAQLTWSDGWSDGGRVSQGFTN